MNNFSKNFKIFFLFISLFKAFPPVRLHLLRSSRLQLFFKIGALKNFAYFTGKHPCWSFFLIKLQALRPATLLKRDSNTGVFL